ncbi:enoyl-CoA hydratase-related protein [Mycobacterium paraintracellulare]|uniref:enoyl-CoA hydratase-related protein n=1 Tax=Mycobacterium paraintracellulare TaxID=1138383 RepID=UPI001926B7D0|nr:enoyl-CoA hydratase-related protein [Mycobacterium paraintracellulare]
MGEDVHATHRDGVATISLERPPVNALRTQTWAELSEALADAVASKPHAIVLRSSLPAIFCAGLDLKEPLSEAAALETRQRLVTTTLASYAACPVPVIAALGGPVVGGGCSLVAQCDIRVATSAASFALAEIDVGRAGGARHLMRHLDQGTVRWMALTGRRLGAEQALLRGLITFLVDDADADALDIARCIAGKDRTAVELVKRSLDVVENLPVSEGYQMEQQVSELLKYRSQLNIHAEAATSELPR